MKRTFASALWMGAFLLIAISLVSVSMAHAGQTPQPLPATRPLPGTAASGAPHNSASVPNAQTAVRPATSAGASQSEPAWPQSFQLVTDGTPYSVGFAVTQPGPVTVQVTSQGAPVKVSVIGPATQPNPQVGTGAMHIDINASAADVQKSSLWIVRVEPAAIVPVTPFQSRQVIASGTVTVQHAPTNVQSAQMELQRMQTASMQRMPAAAAQATSVVAAKKSSYASLVANQQVAQKQRLLALIKKPVALAAGQTRQLPTTGVKQQTPASSQSADTGTGSGSGVTTLGGGSSGSIGSIAPPTITSLSANQGQPNDPILITGSGFGANKGQVHFIIHQGMDRVASVVDSWSDTQILTYVPDATAISAFPGQMYVQNAAGQKSVLTSFQFNPTLDYAVLEPNWKQTDVNVDLTDVVTSIIGAPWRNGSTDFFGHKGDDGFYLTKQLKNGWVVDSVNFAITSKGGNSNANLEASRIGTSSPFVQVHWWMDPFSSIAYIVQITIKGPTGTSYDPN
jgi:hypothetical protein